MPCLSLPIRLRETACASTVVANCTLMISFCCLPGAQAVSECLDGMRRQNRYIEEPASANLAVLPVGLSQVVVIVSLPFVYAPAGFDEHGCLLLAYYTTHYSCCQVLIQARLHWDKTKELSPLQFRLLITLLWGVKLRCAPHPAPACADWRQTSS